MKKREGKTGDLINEKPLKLNEETKKKTDCLLLLCRRWKTSETLARKTVEENQVLIGRDKGFESSESIA